MDSSLFFFILIIAIGALFLLLFIVFIARCIKETTYTPKNENSLPMETLPTQMIQPANVMMTQPPMEQMVQVQSPSATPMYLMSASPTPMHGQSYIVDQPSTERYLVTNPGQYQNNSLNNSQIMDTTIPTTHRMQAVQPPVVRNIVQNLQKPQLTPLVSQPVSQYQHSPDNSMPMNDMSGGLGSRSVNQIDNQMIRMLEAKSRSDNQLQQFSDDTDEEPPSLFLRGDGSSDGKMSNPQAGRIPFQVLYSPNRGYVKKGSAIVIQDYKNRAAFPDSMNRKSSRLKSSPRKRSSSHRMIKRPIPLQNRSMVGNNQVQAFNQRDQNSLNQVNKLNGDLQKQHQLKQLYLLQQQLKQQKFPIQKAQGRKILQSKSTPLSPRRVRIVGNNNDILAERHTFNENGDLGVHKKKKNCRRYIKKDSLNDQIGSLEKKISSKKFLKSPEASRRRRRRTDGRSLMDSPARTISIHNNSPPKSTDTLPRSKTKQNNMTVRDIRRQTNGLISSPSQLKNVSKDNNSLYSNKMGALGNNLPLRQGAPYKKELKTTFRRLEKAPAVRISPSGFQTPPRGGELSELPSGVSSPIIMSPGASNRASKSPSYRLTRNNTNFQQQQQQNIRNIQNIGASGSSTPRYRTITSQPQQQSSQPIRKIITLQEYENKQMREILKTQQPSQSPSLNKQRHIQKPLSQPRSRRSSNSNISQNIQSESGGRKHTRKPGPVSYYRKIVPGMQNTKESYLPAIQETDSNCYSISRISRKSANFGSSPERLPTIRSTTIPQGRSSPLPTPKMVESVEVARPTSINIFATSSQASYQQKSMSQPSSQNPASFPYRNYQQQQQDSRDNKGIGGLKNITKESGSQNLRIVGSPNLHIQPSITQTEIYDEEDRKKYYNSINHEKGSKFLAKSISREGPLKSMHSESYRGLYTPITESDYDQEGNRNKVSRRQGGMKDLERHPSDKSPNNNNKGNFRAQNPENDTRNGIHYSFFQDGDRKADFQKQQQQYQQKQSSRTKKDAIDKYW